MRQALDSLFEKYQVNLALVAHTHAYERTCLIKAGECVENGGTQHITIGSAGAGLEACGDSPIFGPYRSFYIIVFFCFFIPFNFSAAAVKVVVKCLVNTKACRAILTVQAVECSVN